MASQKSGLLAPRGAGDGGKEKRSRSERVGRRLLIPVQNCSPEGTVGNSGQLESKHLRREIR
jgi:hypothetical protein